MSSNLIGKFFSFIWVLVGFMVVSFTAYAPILFFKWLYALISPATELTRVITLCAFWICGGGLTVSLWIFLGMAFTTYAVSVIKAYE